MSDLKTLCSGLCDTVNNLRDENEAIRTLVGELSTVCDRTEQEYLCEVDAAHAEAKKWQAEGDGYGWNFHEGRASGMIWMNIVYGRIKRELTAALAKADKIGGANEQAE